MKDLNSLPFLTREDLPFITTSNIELEIRSYTDVASDFYVIGVTKNGIFNKRIFGNGTGVVKIDVVSLDDFPIMLSVKDDADNFLPGECYVAVNLKLGGNIIYQICSGYIDYDEYLSWPPADLKKGIKQEDMDFTITGADPAAGAEISFTVPNGTIWIVKALTFTLVAAAAAASRLVHIRFTHNLIPVFECISATAQIISETKTYHAFPTTPGGAVAGGDRIIIPIPQRIVLFQDDTIKTVTDNLNAGDNYSAPKLLIGKQFQPIA